MINPEYVSFKAFVIGGVIGALLGLIGSFL